MNQIDFRHWKKVSITIICCYSINTRSRLKRYAETKAYTVRKKLELVTCMRNGEAQCKISREMGIPVSTLRGWLKDEVHPHAARRRQLA